MPTNNSSGHAPTIVGVGKYVLREIRKSEDFLSVLDVASEAGQDAINDAHDRADLGTEIEVMAVSRPFEESFRKVAVVSNPFGRSNNVHGPVVDAASLPTSGI